MKLKIKELFLWARVNEHLSTTGIFEPLNADNLTFTDWRSGSGDVFSKLLAEATLLLLLLLLLSSSSSLLLLVLLLLLLFLLLLIYSGI